MAKQAMFFDGTKSVLLNSDNPEVWKFYSGAPKTAAAKATSNPWVYRAVELVADGVEVIPWAILGADGETITASDDYEDPFGYLVRPDELFAKVARSLVVFGCAYVLKERSRAKVLRLRYLAPDTITVEIDKETGTPTFTRAVNGMQKKLTTDDIMYFWLPDPSVEAGPPNTWPVNTVLPSVEVLDSLNTMAAGYFRRGMVHPFVMLTQGNMPEAEQDKANSLFRRMLTGVGNAFRVVFLNLEKLNPVELGGGLEDLSDDGLSEGARQEIAAGIGVPETLLTSDAANFATAQEDTRRFYQTTIIPLCDLIGEVLETQLFPPGYSIRFYPESMDAFQEDEAARAGALSTYVSAGMPLLIAIDILGIELTDEQRAQIEGAQAQPEPAAPMDNETVTPAPVFEDAEEIAVRKWANFMPVNREWIGEGAVGTQEIAIADELRKWEAKATHYVKRGKPADGPFEARVIPADMRAGIYCALNKCTNSAMVRAVFERTTAHETQPFDSEWATLSRELKRANDLLEAIR